MGNHLALTLIRHGLTKYNEERRYVGATNLPLSATGIAKLKQMKQKITHERGNLLISSDLLRCRQTAEILFGREADFILADLREMDFGEWEGKTYDDLKDTRLYRQWLHDPFRISPPNGEAFKRFEERIYEALKQVLALSAEHKAGHVTVITHGGVIRQLLTICAPVEKAFFEWEVPHGCMMTLAGNLAEVRRGLRFTSLQEAPTTEKITGC